MKTQIQKWGNSLAVRIPQAFASEIGLKTESPVELSVKDGRLVIAPITPSSIKLDDLLAGITSDNLHGEIDFGTPVGREDW